MSVAVIRIADDVSACHQTDPSPDPASRFLSVIRWADDHRMTSKTWIIAGWALMAGAALLAVVAAVQVFASIDNDPGVAVPLRRDVPAPHVIQVTVFLRGVVAAVLAGVAFFSGLACFSWSATRRRDDLLEQILRRLPD